MQLQAMTAVFPAHDASICASHGATPYKSPLAPLTSQYKPHPLPYPPAPKACHLRFHLVLQNHCAAENHALPQLELPSGDFMPLACNVAATAVIVLP